MIVRNENIIEALQCGGDKELSWEEWKRVVEQYPYCEVFVWHYLRELYRGDDMSFESELERLAIRVGDRQAFYNFMIHPKEEKRVFEYNVATNDYFASQGIDVSSQTMSLSEMARRLKAARLAANESAFCTTGGEKNDIEQSMEVAKRGAENDENEAAEGNNDEKIGVKGKTDEGVTNAESAERLRVIQAQVTDLIQRKKYLEALEILRRENDENSKKSCYFAVQIKYLETIINNR